MCRLPSARWPKTWWAEYGRYLYEEEFVAEVDRIVDASDESTSYWVRYGSETLDPSEPVEPK